ncbi:hypothetical protein E3Q22_03883 [Wallemia mellicola]|uniref:Uncharacterized protein n=1 Tax=Wallemia mellicola TaxID=1708541 RepID=A0A4T0M004_9BASI|nr:hypothetical protein E3Q22_03883 [Wallemia mellicola]TIB96478.1 hypothetical protein E3Q17_03840 [Wallemia mellicola]
MVQTSQSMFLSVLLVVSLSLLFVKGNIVDESSILAPRQDYVEGQSTWPLSGLQNNVSPGLGAGLASLYMATLANQRAEGFCAINNDGDRESLGGCIAANVAGCIFGVYSIYRIGNGFLASRDTAPITLTGSNGLVKELTIFDLDLTPGDVLLDYSFDGQQYNLVYRENDHGVPFVRPVLITGNQTKHSLQERDMAQYMDMYYVTWSRGNIDQFIYNPDAKGQLSTEIAEAFLYGDGSYPYYPYNYIHSTTCLGIYDGPSKVSTAKLFVSDSNSLPSDVDSVYSGIDPCWDYGYPYKSE